MGEMERYTVGMIDVRGVRKRFGTRDVLKDISFSVEKAEIVAVMGSSGGGKTTLLRCIAGLIPITEGSVIVDGLDVTHFPEEARQKMGMVFQSAALLDSLSVEDNVLFGVRRHRKLSKQDADKLIDELLESVGMEDAAEKLPAELSGGMRKRVGIARALAMQPQVLLYDEPTTGLDPVTTYRIDKAMLDVKAQFGVTSLLVSHDLTSVSRVADRVIYLDQGQILFEGSPDLFMKSELAPIAELVKKAYAQSIQAGE